jgi:hypothetical protein
MEFPELVVRADVVVRGPRLDEALGQLAGLLAADLADLDAVPVFFVQGLQLVEPLCECRVVRLLVQDGSQFVVATVRPRRSRGALCGAAALE